MSGGWSEKGQRSCVQSHSGEGKLCEETKIAGKNPNSSDPEPEHEARSV